MTDDHIEIPAEKAPAVPAGELVHFNPWRDFNDAPLIVDPFGVEPDREQIEIFLVAFLPALKLPVTVNTMGA